MSAYVITGGCGFIGRTFIERLLADSSHTVRVVDNLSTGRIDALEDFGEIEQVAAQDVSRQTRRIQLIVGDIREVALADAACRNMDTVVHLAANTGVAPSIADPVTDCITNVMGTLNYLEGARKAGIRRFVFASSGATVGECEPPIHEQLPSRPVSPYGASKLAGEAYCSAYARSFGMATVALRFGNVYGPGSFHKDSVVAKFIRRALAGEPLQIYGDGSQTRDFIYIDDLVDAIEAAATRDNVAGEVFQIATSRETTVGELTVALSEALAGEGLPVPRVEFLERRPGDVRRNFADTRKAKQMLGWSAKTELRDGLRRTIRWMIARAA
jgi:UDP-glucose 4-epimerase